MDDHLKRISEKQQVESDMKYFGETDDSADVFSQTKEEFYAENIDNYDDTYNMVENGGGEWDDNENDIADDIENEIEIDSTNDIENIIENVTTEQQSVTAKPVEIQIGRTSINPAELAENEFEVNFHNPDLSKLPKEIPIPEHYSSDIVRQSESEIRFVETQELPVVEQQGLEEVQHRRQLALRKACYMPRLRTEVYNQTSRFYSIDSLTPQDFQHFIVDDESKLIFCAISKAGNTNWKRILAVLGGAIKNKQKWDFKTVHDVPMEPGTPIHEPWFFKRLSEYTMEEIKERLTTRFYRKFTFVWILISNSKIIMNKATLIYDEPHS